MARGKKGPARTSRRRREMEERQRVFLDALRRTGDAEAARASIDVGESTVRRWRGKDDVFRAAYKEAQGAKGAAPEGRPKFTGRKRVFLDAFERAGVVAAALRAAEATAKDLRRWVRDDAEFLDSYVEARGRIRARADEETERRIAAGEQVSAAGRKRVFLKHLASVGTTTAGCEAAGITLKTLKEWLERDEFAEAFAEAKQRFRDHIEEAIVQRIDEGKNGGLLQFKARAELPEKYGKGEKTPPKEQAGVTWEDIERAAREPYDATGAC